MGHRSVIRNKDSIVEYPTSGADNRYFRAFVADEGHVQSFSSQRYQCLVELVESFADTL